MTLVKFVNGNAGKVYKPAYNDVFESFFNSDTFQSKRTLNRLPAVNIAEKEHVFQIELAVPGLKKEDFKINLEGNQLCVSVEKKEEKTESDESIRYNKREFNYSSFSRTFTLPESADQNKIQAEYNDGILIINVAKREEAKSLAREIAVK